MSDVAITTMVSGLITIVTMVIGFLTLWVKLKYGVQQATSHAKVAAETAAEAKNTAVKTNEVIMSRLNGGIEKFISDAIEPICKELKDHTALDERNMKEIGRRLDGLVNRLELALKMKR